jgi:hypothetical protein
MTRRGTFARWQPTYAAHQIATFPVKIVGDDKKPAITAYGRVGLRGSEQLAFKFRDAAAFAFMCGKRSRVTVLDIDSTDERILADGMAKHGATSLIVRTASGKYHGYYEYNGERRRIRPWRGLAIDVLGAGYVVAPPSRAPRGRYEIIQGSLDDLDQLPVMRGLEGSLYAQAPRISEEPSGGVPDGERNNRLFGHCMRQAHSCENLDALLNAARVFNDHCSPLLTDDEVIRTARSAWDYTAAGRNRFGQHGAWIPVELSRKLARHPYACALYVVLRAENGPDSVFPIANAMAGTTINFGWRRFAQARKVVTSLGLVEKVSPQTQHKPALYRWPRSPGLPKW